MEETGESVAVNTDEFVKLAYKLGVRDLPTLIVYRHGGITYRVYGLHFNK